jgi:D-3-phosphoglycerate dehydrogenase / 2-oxoglutarate reductase
MDKRILSTGSVLPIAEQILGRFGQIEIASHTDEQSLITQMKGTIGLIVRGVTQISARVIESGSDLRVIGRTGVGYDNVNIKAATERGIPVVFTPGAGARAVAEGAMAMILALVKKLPESGKHGIIPLLEICRARYSASLDWAGLAGTWHGWLTRLTCG